MLDFHHRMPLILRQDELRPWLFDKTFALEAVQEKKCHSSDINLSNDLGSTRFVNIYKVVPYSFYREYVKI